ncbi:MAG TPA: M90 family metallopeptidase [Usitatibacteraceae bacterium]|nr:M90 family metallopeptidase [Usitatibacteraceae bacterium]
MFGWFGKRDDEAKPIDEGLWESATVPYLFMRGLPPADGERLRGIAGRFLARKHFFGTHDLDITPLMHVQVAAQASILVLELGLEWYDGWSEIIVYPGQFVPEREIVDEAGVVHLVNDPMAGEAWLGGPVILSYEDVAMTSDEDSRVAGYNVVIHEFAHKLDMLNGNPNGCPPLHPGMALADWRRAFSGAYEDFCRRVDLADRLAEEDDGAALDALPIDPYASESPGEFFAVASEAFFETPEWLEPAYPAVYAQLRGFYRQDPLARLPAAPGA